MRRLAVVVALLALGTGVPAASHLTFHADRAIGAPRAGRAIGGRVPQVGAKAQGRNGGLEAQRRDGADGPWYQLRRAAFGGAESEGERLYRAGRFHEAYEAFRREADEDGPTAVLDYDAGNALYRMGRYEDAQRTYAAALSGPARLRQKSQYNLGNALFKAAEKQPDRAQALRGAVTAYEEALLLDPADSAAKWNLELALRELEKEREQQRRGGGGGGGGGGDDPQQQNQSEPTGGGEQRPAPAAPSPAESEPEPQAEAGEREGALSEAEAKQLLEAIQGEESEALESRDPGRVRRPSGRRDW